MTSHSKEKCARNAVLLVLVSCLISLASGSNAQNLVPPGFYGWGWGDQPYWLKPTFDYAYELNRTSPGDRRTCYYEDRPTYSRGEPHRFLGVRSVYVCRPDDQFTNR